MSKHPKGYLSPHFNQSEFDCHDGTPVPKDHIPALKEFCHKVLEPMRSQYGACTIFSGYRTRAWNARTPGAASNSWHVFDAHPEEVGADIGFARGSAAEWRQWALRNPNVGGIGSYGDGHIHLDQGPRREWNGA